MKQIYMKTTAILLLLTICMTLSAGSKPDGYFLKISKTEKTSFESTFKMGSSASPSGPTVLINSSHMLMDGKPVLPVMGEIHFSRVKDTEWKRELLKMKAGGINILSTYIFWIHHEEVKGMYNWEGQRNLRRFLEICKELNMPVVLRIGPWAHGEVRNGGFPEWLVNSGLKLRSENKDYLTEVKKWYAEIYRQADGLLWKDGGPVIGIQLENEYRGNGAHLMTLKKMAVELGFDVPLYTRTGWPKLTSPVPYGEIIPLYGDYADGFWDRSVAEMPGDYGKSFLFRSFRSSTVIATEQLPAQSENDASGDTGYPYFTCELGGGMMTSYHRRINIAPMDVYSMALVRVGSGSNLPGYYMYHGGNNPDGQLTTLNERQASNYTNNNDLPVKSYDFQAPLGEFGQINPHYHLLRKLHLFLKDFGGELALMKPYFPENTVTDFKTDTLLRWSVRTNDNSGYIFVNNYQRLKTLSPKNDIQFTLDFPGEKLQIPQKTMSVPSGSAFFIPFNMDLNGAKLVYATAQPVAKIEEAGRTTYVFSEIQGIPVELAIDNYEVSVKSFAGKRRTEGNRIYLSGLKTGTSPAVRLRTASNREISIILLNQKTSLKLWKGKFAGKERIFISNADLTYDGNRLELVRDKSDCEVFIYPALNSLEYNGKEVKPSSDGIFSKYKIKLPEIRRIKAGLTKIKDMDLPLRVVSFGTAKVAEMPRDEDFTKAAEWKITLPEYDLSLRNLTLRITYKGDVARVYAGDTLLTDNFYNGKPMDINLGYFADKIFGNDLKLSILPLIKNEPVYFQQQAGITFKGADYLLETPTIEVIESRSAVLTAK